jgi:hypothetical protein
VDATNNSLLWCPHFPTGQQSLRARDSRDDDVIVAPVDEEEAGLALMGMCNAGVVLEPEVSWTSPNIDGAL